MHPTIIRQISQIALLAIEIQNLQKYFQFIHLDMTQLNSEVIRAFTKSYDLNEDPVIDEIVKDKIDFHAHTMIRSGYKMGLYSKKGSSIPDLTEEVIWRQADHDGNLNSEICKKWFTWRSNTAMKSYDGELKGLRSTEDASVHNPIDVVERIKNGKFLYVLPRFE